MIWCDMMWCDMMWCDMVWCGVILCGVMWCDMMWCDMMSNDIMRGDVKCSDMICNHDRNAYLYSVILREPQRRWCDALVQSGYEVSAMHCAGSSLPQATAHRPWTSCSPTIVSGSQLEATGSHLVDLILG